MPSVVATLKVKEDKIEEAKEFLGKLVAEVLASEPGTEAYILHQRRDDPTIFVAYERYADEEALKTHAQNVASHGAGLAAILAGAPEILVVDEI